MGADARVAPADAARPARDGARRRRAGAGEEAGGPRPPLDPRSRSSTGRGGTRRRRRSGGLRISSARTRSSSPARCAAPRYAARDRRLSIVRARVADGSGEVDAVWFNQPWLAERLKPGTRVRLRGRALARGRASTSARTTSAARRRRPTYAPVYSASEELPVKKLRELVGAALAHARRRARTRCRPGSRSERAARPRRTPLRRSTGRATPDEAEAGRRRLAFDELLVLQLGLAAARPRARGRGAPALPRAGRARRALPRRAAVRADGATRSGDRARSTPTSQRAAPMQRLLQGDVGSGKTVVALYALLRAVEARSPGRADGADRDARRAALPHARRALRRASACASCC